MFPTNLKPQTLNVVPKNYASWKDVFIPQLEEKKRVVKKIIHHVCDFFCFVATIWIAKKGGPPKNKIINKQIIN